MPNSSDFNRFAVNPVNIDIQRSMFNMNHSVKWSANIGECIPFDCIEVVPGDTLEIDTSKVIRLQPLVAPIMDEIMLDCYWFFVPHRLVWNHWINFMGENTESAWTPETHYTIPKIYIPKGGFDVGTIADYMGVPPKVGSDSSGTNKWISALPFRSYALIMDQWFRSEAVMDPVHVHVDDTNRTGVNTADQVTDIELGGKPFIACKFFDYFTGALPSPQRGEPVSIKAIKPEFLQVHSYNAITSQFPYSSSDIRPGKDINNRYGTLHFSQQRPNDSTYSSLSTAHDIGFNTTGNLDFESPATSTLSGQTYILPDNLFVNIRSSDLESITINDLRTAFAIQRYLERSARYGGRYQEFIKGFFNVDSPDARLQRSEYLGGSRVSLNINSVESTSQTEAYPVGSVAGMSVTGDRNSDFTKSFTEHGFVIGIAVARYHHSYQQSLERMWTRNTNYEFYNPVFANLGEQSIYNHEICFTEEDIEFQTFGYQERWSEYRYRQNRVAGEMRTVYSTPLDMWHLGDYYESLPSLSPEWLREDKTNLDRCLAVTSEVADQMICDFYIECKASRPMPLYSIPGLIDHH